MEKQNILIADDETNLCRILDAELRKAGYAVTVVHDGAQAVEQVRCVDFQMILLDVRMPILDGLSALHEIRKIKKETPVVIMTAYESQDTAASALSMGATACVNKPFDLEGLVAFVKATLDERDEWKCAGRSAFIRTVLFNKDQPIVLEIHDGEYAGRYESRIEDKDDQTLMVIRPPANGGCICLRAGTPLSIGFAGEDAFYSFETAVLANREDPLPTMVVGKPAVIYRIQRRKYPRRLARIPAELTPIERGGHDTGSGQTVQVHTEDIGAGGLKVTTESELPNGAEVEIRAVDAPGITPFFGMGKITRARRAATNSHARWEYGIQFTKMDDEARRALREMVESRVLG